MSQKYKKLDTPFSANPMTEADIIAFQENLQRAIHVLQQFIALYKSRTRR